MVDPDRGPRVRVQTSVSLNGQTVETGGNGKMALISSDLELPILKLQKESVKKSVRTDPRDPPIAHYPQCAAHQQQDDQDDPKILHGSIVRGSAIDGS